jgi:hypothetical protein
MALPAESAGSMFCTFMDFLARTRANVAGLFFPGMGNLIWF